MVVFVRCWYYCCFYLIGLGCVLYCTACGTANWQAPLESRHGVADEPTSMHQALTSSAKTYRVQAGDTLSAIAWRSQQDLQVLARLNGLQPPYLIRVGQVLRLRAPNSVSTSRRSPAAKPRSPPTTRPINPSALEWVWPLTGQVMATFKAGDPRRKGIKLAAALGTPVQAAAAGRVVYSGNGLIGYGQLIIIKHTADFLSAYGHNRKLLVKTGQSVTKGQKIAELGRTNADKIWLHFEVRQHGQPIDPLRVLPQ